MIIDLPSHVVPSLSVCFPKIPSNTYYILVNHFMYFNVMTLTYSLDYLTHQNNILKGQSTYQIVGLTSNRLAMRVLTDK